MRKLDTNSFDIIEMPLRLNGTEKKISDILRGSLLEKVRTYHWQEFGHDARVAESWGDFYLILNEILNDDQ